MLPCTFSRCTSSLEKSCAGGAGGALADFFCAAWTPPGAARTSANAATRVTSARRHTCANGVEVVMALEPRGSSGNARQALHRLQLLHVFRVHGLRTAARGLGRHAVACREFVQERILARQVM